MHERASDYLKKIFFGDEIILVIIIITLVKHATAHIIPNRKGHDFACVTIFV